VPTTTTAARMRGRGDDASRSPASARTFAFLVGLALLVAGCIPLCACAAVEKSAMAQWHETIHLDAEHIAVVRHVTFTVDNRDSVKSIRFEGELDPRVTWMAAKPGITLTAIPDSSDQPAPPTWRLDYARACSATCKEGVTLIARITGDPPADRLDLNMAATLIAEGAPGPRTLDTDLSIHADPAPSFDGVPTTVVKRFEGSFKLTSSKPKAKQRLEIRIDGAALTAPLRYPLVATVEVYEQTTRMEQADVPGVWIMIGGQETLLSTGLPYMTTDVLPLCNANRACVLPVTMRSEYTSHSDKPGDDLKGSAALVWRIRVRIDAFDGRQLPAGAISIGEP